MKGTLSYAIILFLEPDGSRPKTKIIHDKVWQQYKIHILNYVTLD